MGLITCELWRQHDASELWRHFSALGSCFQVLPPWWRDMSELQRPSDLQSYTTWPTNWTNSSENMVGCQRGITTNFGLWTHKPAWFVMKQGSYFGLCPSLLYCFCGKGLRVQLNMHCLAVNETQINKNPEWLLKRKLDSDFNADKYVCVWGWVK